MKRIILIVALIITGPRLFSQDDSGGGLSAGGYATWLHTAIFRDFSDTWVNTGMLHNRLNFKAYPDNKSQFALEIRNRIVIGDMLLLDPSYASSLDSDIGWVDMSWNVVNENSIIFNTMVDRLYFDYNAGKLQLRIGRQRINWSQALVWNPNDIFNTYSFFDFDYVERPGSDAVRLTYSTGPSSAAETAVKLNHEGKVTVAALYRFSLLNADIQFLAGETDQEMATIGTGWSATAGANSIRGEATLFYPFGSSSLGESTAIITAGIDRAFSDKFSTMLQAMYSNRPLELDSFDQLYTGGLKASQIAFSEFSAMGQVTWTPVPLINISFSGIWYPDLKGFYAGPSLDFSMAENVDFSFLYQHFNSVISGNDIRMNLGFIRIRYSF